MLYLDHLNNVSVLILASCGVIGASLLFVLLLVFLAFKYIQRRVEYRRQHTIARHIDHYSKLERQRQRQAAWQLQNQKNAKKAAKP